MAQAIYATQADLSVPPKALGNTATPVITNALARASSMADSYIRKRFQLPLQEYTQSLTQAVADIATWIIMKDRGFDPNSDNTKQIQGAYRDALNWLQKVANNETDPAFIDANGVGQDETSAVSTEVNKDFVYYPAVNPFNPYGNGGGGGGGFFGGGGCR